MKIVDSIIDKATNDQMVILLNNDIKFELNLKINSLRKYIMLLHNNKKLIQALCSHPKFNYKEHGFGRFLTSYRKDLLYSSIDVGDYDYVLENKRMNDGILTVLEVLQNKNRSDFIIDVLYGAKLSKNQELINIILMKI